MSDDDNDDYILQNHTPIRPSQYDEIARDPEYKKSYEALKDNLKSCPERYQALNHQLCMYEVLGLTDHKPWLFFQNNKVYHLTDVVRRVYRELNLAYDDDAGFCAHAYYPYLQHCDRICHLLEAKLHITLVEVSSARLKLEGKMNNSE